MSIQLILRAPDRATMRTFGQNNRLMEQVEVDDQGTLEWRLRPNVNWTWWPTPGNRLMRTPRIVRATQAVDTVQGGRFGFTVPGGNFPAWVNSDLTIEDLDGNVVGNWDQNLGNVAGFLPTGDLPSIGTELVPVSPPTYLSGVVGHLKLEGKVSQEEELAVDEASDDPEWDRNAITNYIRRNGTAVDTGDFIYYEIDGVQLFRPADVRAKMIEWGTLRHEYL